MAAQIANGVAPSAAAVVGEAEREGVMAKAGATKAGGTKVLAAKIAPAAQANSVVLPGTGGKVVAGIGKSGAGAKVAGGALLSGKGFSLGLGLGLGPWGPIILGVVGAAAVYGYIKSRQVEALQSDEEVEMNEAMA